MTQAQPDARLRAAVRALGVGGRMNCAQASQIAADLGSDLAAVERAALLEGIVPEKYSRNIGTLGLDGQQRLLCSTAAIVGLGGLGGHVLECLARLGVGRLVGIDPDVFAESNLNRQLLSSVDSLGCPKAGEAAMRVRSINPAVQFAGHQARLEDVPDDVLGNCGVVFDCLDNIPSRLVLAGRCDDLGLTLVHGAIAGWCGQAALCPPGSGIIRKLYDGGKTTMEQRLGNLPFTAATAAYLMASLGARVLLGAAPAGCRVTFFDLQNGDWENIEL